MIMAKNTMGNNCDYDDINRGNDDDDDESNTLKTQEYIMHQYQLSGIRLY